MSFVLLLAICWMAEMRCSADAFRLDSLVLMLRIRLWPDARDGQFADEGETVNEIVREPCVWPVYG